MEGRVEIYCGQGRGKTSCAIGQCVKAAGQEKQIIMVQFLKGKETEELSFFKRLEPEVQLFRFEKYERLYEDLNEEEKKEQDHFIYNGLKYAHKVIDTRQCDMVVLDEVLGLLDLGLLKNEELVEMLENRSDDQTIIMTGRQIPEALIPYVLVNLHNCDNETDFTPEDRALCAQFYQFWAKPFRKKIIKLHRKLHSLLSRLITKIRTSKRILAKHHRKILDGHIVPDDYDPQTMVLVAKHGKSYHDMRCVGAKRVNLKAMTVVEALKNGYQPCGLCRKKDMDLRTLKKVFSDQQLVEFRAFIDAIYQVVKMTGVTYEFTCPICGDTASASRNKKDGSYIAKCNHCHTSIRL